MAEQLYYTGSGTVSISAVNPSTQLPDANGFRYLGNTNMAMVGLTGTNMIHTESESGFEKEDFNLFKQLKSNVEIRLAKYSIENLQLALFGTKTVNAGATVTDEVVVAPEVLTNSVYLANFNVTAFTELTNSAGSTTYDEGTDYNWNVFGKLTFPAGTTITAGQSLKASYVAGTSDRVNAFADVQPRWWIRIEGLNLARTKTKAPVLLDMPLVLLDPLAQWDLISTGKTTTEELALRGKLLYVRELDSAPIGSGRIPGGFFTATQLVEA